MLELVRRALGTASVPRSTEFWRWKHLENPFGPSPGLVAESGGEIVGLRVFLRWRWRDGSGQRPAVRAVDTATHPDHRGCGLFTRLTRRLLERAEEEGCHFVFNTPNRISRAGYLKMGWRDVVRVPVYLRPMPGSRLAGTRGGNFPELPFPTAAELFREAGLAPLLAPGEPERRLHTDRDPAYLHWRYADPPGLRYHAAWEMGEGTGAAILFRARTRRRLREVSLSEILTGEGREDVLAAARLVRRVARDSGADYLVACAARGTPELRVLKGAGFLPWTWPGPHLTVRPMASPPASGADPLRPADWRLSLGDLEIF